MPGQVALFSFQTLASFPVKDLKGLAMDDPLWGMEASRRCEALRAVQDPNDPAWCLAYARYLYDVAEYREAIRYAELAEATKDAAPMATALATQCQCYLLLGNGDAASAALYRLQGFAIESGDAFVTAMAELMLVLCRERDVEAPHPAFAEVAALENLAIFDRTIGAFRALGETEWVLQASVYRITLLVTKAKYFSAFDEVERALRLSQAEDCWKFTGRFLLLATGAAIDQGYRNGVVQVLHRVREWFEYHGDVWGQIETNSTHGRLLSYEMTPDDPSLTAEPDRYLIRAMRQAEAHNMAWMLAGIDNLRAWLYRKAGDHRTSRRILGEDSLEQDEREARALSTTKVTEATAKAIQSRIASRLHDGIEDAPDAFLVFDALRDEEGRPRDFINEYRNRVGERLLGRGVIYVCLYSEFCHRPHLAGLGDALLAAAEERESYEDVREVPTEDGIFWFQRRVVPSGNGAVLTLRDVTAERNVTTALRAAADSAAQSDRAKSAFLANMSHEIRTPLNGILGLSRMLAETDLSPTQRAYVQDIVGSGDMLLDLIGGVLDLSRIESNNLTLSPEPVRLWDLVTAIAKLYRGQAEEKGIALFFEIKPGVPDTVMADDLRLRQILANLVGNAVKFTVEGKVALRVSPAEGGVRFEVTDTGVGIPADQIGRVFDRFQQARTSQPFGGAGLGLTITKGLVELMGGRIAVESEEGEGTAFTVDLPLPDAQATLAESPAEKVRNYRGKRALLADDNRVNALVSRHALVKLGFEVATAENGLQALEKMEREPFDIVFMDVRMPEMNGLEATRRYRDAEGGGHTPIIALTAGALAEERQECFEAGMDDFVSKPFTDESLRTVLAKWLA